MLKSLYRSICCYGLLVSQRVIILLLISRKYYKLWEIADFFLSIYENKQEKVSHWEPWGCRESNGLMSRTVFMSLTYCFFSLRRQTMASSTQDTFALKQKSVPDSCPPLFSCCCAVTLQILYQKLILLSKELIYYLKVVKR